MTPDVLGALRAGTRQAHERLEQDLALLHDAGGARVLDDWDHRGHEARWLHADLLDTGYTAGDVAAWPRCPELPAVGSVDELLGCLYRAPV